MTCESCKVTCRRFGPHRNGLRRFRCPQLTRPTPKPTSPRWKAPTSPRSASCCRFGCNSLRFTQRITDLDINTLMKILVKAGDKCEKLMGRVIVNVSVKDVQADEIWGYVQKTKARTAYPDSRPGLSRTTKQISCRVEYRDKCQAELRYDDR